MLNVVRFLAALSFIALAVALPMALEAVNSGTALAEATRLDLTPDGGIATAGVSFDITVTAYNSDNTVDETYPNSVTFSSSDPTADLPDTPQGLTGGTATFSVTLFKSDSQWIQITDGSLSEIEYWTVSPGELDHIEISPSTATIVAGSNQTYTAQAFDEFNNPLGDVTSDTTFSIEPGAGGIWTGPDNSVYSSQYAGTWTVTGSYAALTDTASLTVNASVPDHIVVSPDTATITAGGPQAYTAVAFDQFDNPIANVTTLTTFSINPGAGGSWSTSTYTSQVAGVWTVTGSYTGLTDIASLTVNPGTPHHIVVFPDTNTIAAGAAQAYTAQLFDLYNNNLGDVTTTTIFSTLPAAGGVWVGSVYTSQYVGTWTVTGTHLTFSDQATLTVIASNAHHIVISPDAAAITAGGIQAYTATAFDQFNNNLGDVTPLTTFTIQTGAGGSWTNNVYSSQYVGTWTVTGIHLGLTDVASITVTAAPASQIAISPATGTTTAGAAFNITVTARDTYGNSAITYAGTVAFTSSDTAATLPADYAFQPSDAGVHVFSISLSTAGSQSISVTDKANAALTDSRTWFVESSPIPANRPPAQPGNTSPANGATGFPVTATLQSSAFSDPDSGNTHVASQWQITAAPGNYSSPVFDSGTRTAQLTTIAIPSGVLSYSTTYYWHMRHQDNRGAWSAWSAETSFGTAAQPLADFSVGSVSGSGGAISILFSNLSTGGVAPITYAWDFQNDGAVDSAEREPRYTYTSPGTYTVSLSIQDAVGNANTRVKTNYLTVLSSGAATVVTADGQVSVLFPDGAVAGTPVLTIDNSGTCVLSDIPEGFAKGDTCFIIKLLDEAGTEVPTLSRPIDIKVKYAAEDLAAADGDPGKLVLAYWDKVARRWTVLDTSVNADETTLSASTSHLSLWAVLVATSKAEGGGGTPLWIWLVGGLVILVAAGLIAWKSISIRVVRDDPWRR